jgi:hypothetical protein
VSAAKQQVQDLQSERKQLQKKLVSCRQQLAELKATHDAAQQELLLLRNTNTQLQQQQQQSAHASTLSAAGKEADEERQQQQQHREMHDLQVQLAEATARADRAQQQLSQSQQGTQQLQERLAQERQLCARLTAQVKQLELEAAAAAVAAVAAAPAHKLCSNTSANERNFFLTFDAAAQTVPAAAVADGASSAQEQQQQLQEELSSAKRQMHQAVADRDAAFRELQNALNSLHGTRQQVQLLQQEMDGLAQEQQRQQQGDDPAAQQQQQQQYDQHVQLLQQQLAEARLLLRQQEEQAAAATEQQWQPLLQDARAELEQCRQQLLHAQADVQNLRAAGAAFEQQLLSMVQSAWKEEGELSALLARLRLSAADYPAVDAAAAGVDVTCQQKVLQAVQRLVLACQQLYKQQQHAQEAVKALALSEAKRQSSELALLQLQEQLQFAQANLLAQQQQQQSSHSTFISLVRSLEQLHQSAHVTNHRTAKSAAAADGVPGSAAGTAGGPSSGGGSMLPRTPRTTDAQQQPCNPAAAAWDVSGGGASMLAGPIPCSSPQLSVTMEGLARPAAAAAAAAAERDSILGTEAPNMAQLRSRLSQLSHDLLTHVLPATAGALGLHQHQQQTQQVGGGLSLERLQAQAAGHDQLMEHMRCMWQQVSTREDGMHACIYSHGQLTQSCMEMGK